MQLASQGTRVSTRNVSNFISRTHPTQLNRSRGIHIPVFVRSSITNSVSNPGASHDIFSQARKFIGSLVNDLTAPGRFRTPPLSQAGRLTSAGSLRSPHIPSMGRSLHSGAHARNIQQGLSFPVRVALSRPFGAPFLPRAPTVPRCTTQVGLGAARNFSSTRPIFQNLVQNVPIAGRAFWEADWDIKMQQERHKHFAKAPKRKTSRAVSREMQRQIENVRLAQALIADENDTSASVQENETDMQYYFRTPAVADVTTYLLIPLAPTPTNRIPLPVDDPTHHPLLPLHMLYSVHNAHTTHSLRVSALFSRLDAAHVWNRGVSYSAYSHGSRMTLSAGAGAEEGVCTVLKVTFKGWTAAEVRGVIGESGSGWCALEEVRGSERSHVREYVGMNADNESDVEVQFDDSLSETSSVLSARSESDADIYHDQLVEIDPAQSFILPTLDFSSSFLASSGSPTSHPTSLHAGTNTNTPSFPGSPTSFNLDLDSHSDSDLSEYCIVEPPSESIRRVVHGHVSAGASFGVGFSSEFVRRADENELRRMVF